MFAIYGINRVSLLASVLRLHTGAQKNGIGTPT